MLWRPWRGLEVLSVSREEGVCGRSSDFFVGDLEWEALRGESDVLLDCATVGFVKSFGSSWSTELGFLEDFFVKRLFIEKDDYESRGVPEKGNK